MPGNGDQNDGFIVKLRGLPWSATTDDIQKFFKNSKILNGKNGIHMTTSREGRPSGEAFVEFETEDDLKMALNRDREHMGSRYIEVFKVNRAEMDWVIKRSGPTYGISDDGCVRLRGLPFGCSKEEIAQFFTGLEIVPNGITLLTDYSGRSSGEAYVQFVNKEVAEKALLKHREKIGHRYIEIFRSSLSEVNSVLGYTNNRRGGGGGGGGGGGSNLGPYNSRPSPYDRGDRFGNNNRFQSRGSRNFKGSNFSNNNPNNYNNYDRPPHHWSNNNHDGLDGGDGGGGIMMGRGPLPPPPPPPNTIKYEMDSWGDIGQPPMNDRNSSGLHCVHMRGLPFKATMMDIADFFKPIVPINIRLIQDHNGRASGEADVEFASHDDAVRAMSKDKGHMQHRYIELFLNSTGGNNNDGGMMSGGGGGYGRRRM